MVAAPALTPPFFHAALISSSMYGPASALSPCPRRHGAKNTHPRFANTGPSWSKACWLNMPGALPWLYKTAGNGPLPSGLYRTPCKVRLPLGNVTTPVAGEAKANAASKTISQPDLAMGGNSTALAQRLARYKKAPRFRSALDLTPVTSLPLPCARRAGTCCRRDSFHRLLVIIGEFRTLRHRKRVLLERVHHQLHRFLQLRIAAGHEIVWRDFFFHVRVYAVVLHVPLAAAVVKRYTRRGNGATVHELRVIIDSHQTAPCPLADKRTEFGVAEVPGQSVTSGAGIFVDDHGLGPEDCAFGCSEIFAFARHPVIGEWPAQVVDNVIRGSPSAIEALINHRGFAANLGKEVPVERCVTAKAGVRKIDVGDTAVGHFVYFFQVGIDPAAIAQRRFIINGYHRDIVCALAIRRWTNLQDS